MSAGAKRAVEAKFATGDAGVDGLDVEETMSAEESEKAKAKESLFRGRTWLGREALLWLLYRSESTESICALEDVPVHVVFRGKLLLKGLAGDVVEMSVKGETSPYSQHVKRALLSGLMPQLATLHLAWGEREFDCTVDAETFGVRSAKLPDLLNEDDSEQANERLQLCTQLSAVLDALNATFMAVRIKPNWDKAVVPSMLSWLQGEEAAATQPAQWEKSRRVRAAK